MIAPTRPSAAAHDIQTPGMARLPGQHQRSGRAIAGKKRASNSRCVVPEDDEIVHLEKVAAGDADNVLNL